MIIARVVILCLEQHHVRLNVLHSLLLLLLSILRKNFPLRLTRQGADTFLSSSSHVDLLGFVTAATTSSL